MFALWGGRRSSIVASQPNACCTGVFLVGRKHESGEEADGKHGRSYRLHWPHDGKGSLVEVSMLHCIGFNIRCSTVGHVGWAIQCHCNSS